MRLSASLVFNRKYKGLAYTFTIAVFLLLNSQFLVFSGDLLLSLRPSCWKSGCIYIENKKFATETNGNTTLQFVSTANKTDLTLQSLQSKNK